MGYNIQVQHKLFLYKIDLSVAFLNILTYGRFLNDVNFCH